MNLFYGHFMSMKMYGNYFTENRDQCLSMDLCGPRDPYGLDDLDEDDSRENDLDDLNDHLFHSHVGQL